MEFRTVTKGTIIHDNSAECLGLVTLRSGQLRSFILSEDGREITINRLFEYDTSLLSASCVMPDMQFNVMIEAEKDSEFWSIPACLFKNIMDESLPVANYARSLLSSNFSELMWLMEQIMWKSFDKRLAGFLLEEASIEGTNCLKTTHEITPTIWVPPGRWSPGCCATSRVRAWYASPAAPLRSLTKKNYISLKICDENRQRADTQHAAAIYQIFGWIEM